MTSQVELRHLRYFVAVAQTLHFGRAAERLGITQPVLSDQIRRLETLMGVQLFYRTKRVVQLTEAGSIFLTDAVKLLKQANQAIATAQAGGPGEGRDLENWLYRPCFIHGHARDFAIVSRSLS